MKKRYGLVTAIAMVIGNVIGSGVFVKGGKVLSLTGGNMVQAVNVSALVGLICIICSLVFAELSARSGKVNGVIDYAENALGPGYAYYAGWFMATIYYPAMVAILAFFSAVFTLRFFGVNAIDFAHGTVSTEAVGLAAGYIMIGCGMYAVASKGEGPKHDFFSEVDKQNGFVIKSSLAGIMLIGFWFAWTCLMWMKGPDFMGGLHNNMWVGWEPDEICVISLYAMYIPMFVSLMVKAKDLNFFKRFVMPVLGILCCIFMVVCCYIGKGYKQIIGYLVFFAIVMFIGKLMRGKMPKAA